VVWIRRPWAPNSAHIIHVSVLGLQIRIPGCTVKNGKNSRPTEITPETPKPGYDKEGKRVVGEKAIAPAPEGFRWSWRNLVANTTITFGINNSFDMAPPLSVDNVPGFGGKFDTASGTNFYQRYFWFSLDKKL
jgi:hypothetical protein